MRNGMNKKQKKVLIRIIITFVLLILLRFIPVEGYVRMALYRISEMTSSAPPKSGNRL